ncbi:MFS transporter superfamily [Fusarium oxysporum f. sp. vasinfectum]|nr:MFS transporter superfamily [Fusarium oxysporum f. sp. vasinfectum]
MAGGAIPTAAPQLAGGYLTGRALIYPPLPRHLPLLPLGILLRSSRCPQQAFPNRPRHHKARVHWPAGHRRGYKLTILMGLTLYSLGAVLFWPVAKSADSNANGRAVFGGFCACTLVIACGLATLETAANSYAVVIGAPESASARLQFCQSWNGVASFIGPLIASKFFFTGENQNNLTNVQYVYLAVACAGAAVGVLFFFAKLPEVSEAVLEDDQAGHVAQGSIWKQWNMWFAFGAQFCYVGAQVTIATFFINYAHENGDITTAKGSNMLSYALITFTVGRFVATGLAVIFSSEFIMVVYSCCAIALTAYVSAAPRGVASVGILIAVFFFMAPMYPTIFAMGTRNLGHHTRRAAGILVMGVSGGAVFPPVQGAIADAKGTRISYIVPTIGFVYVLGYVAVNWVRGGITFMAPKAEESTVDEITYDNEKNDVIVEQREKKNNDMA